MRVLLASSEVHPYSKTGGLADMVGAMAKALARDGHQVGVVTPLYRGIREKFPGVKQTRHTLKIPLGGRMVEGEIWTLEAAPGLTLYFVSQPEYYFRGSLYQEGGRVYPDNEYRFLYLTKALVHIACEVWQPDVVHVHDWQVSAAPLLIKHAARTDGWKDAPRTCLTIHNLAYQGVFPPSVYALTGLPWDYFTAEGAEFYGQFNFLKTGIEFSDSITTVSPRYAREILTEEYGCALDGVLRRRQGALAGILNGVDYHEWNTDRNPHLKHAYSLRNPEGKNACKRDIQKEFHLPQKADVPVFASVTRLTEQKGNDLILGALEEMSASDMQFVLLGSGDPGMERAFQSLARRFPERCAVHLGYDNALAHRIEAGADFFLMPSRFEPCGLNQMYSLRYGTIPIVRVTGGLDDSVVDAAEDAGDANGIKFYDYTPRALAKGIRKALTLFHHPRAMRHYQKNAMSADFSWERTTHLYEAVYKRLLL